MPAPLLWLGAAAIGMYTADKANAAYLERKQVIEFFPGESAHISQPVNGSIVTCSIYGVLDHTGIWVNGNIYELAGSGLVRCVSPQRFIHNRSGTQIYVACDANNNAVYSQQAADRAQSLLFSFINYHLLNQNCHKFVAQILADTPSDVSSFSDLNTFLQHFFKVPIRWNLTQINFR